jgi:hypothetical protein
MRSTGAPKLGMIADTLVLQITTGKRADRQSVQPDDTDALLPSGAGSARQTVVLGTISTGAGNALGICSSCLGSPQSRSRTGGEVGAAQKIPVRRIIADQLAFADHPLVPVTCSSLRDGCVMRCRSAANAVLTRLCSWRRNRRMVDNNWWPEQCICRNAKDQQDRDHDRRNEIFHGLIAKSSDSCGRSNRSRAMIGVSTSAARAFGKAARPSGLLPGVQANSCQNPKRRLAASHFVHGRSRQRENHSDLNGAAKIEQAAPQLSPASARYHDRDGLHRLRPGLPGGRTVADVNFSGFSLPVRRATSGCRAVLRKR